MDQGFWGHPCKRLLCWGRKLRGRASFLLKLLRNRPCLPHCSCLAFHALRSWCYLLWVLHSGLPGEALLSRRPRAGESPDPSAKAVAVPARQGSQPLQQVHAHPGVLHAADGVGGALGQRGLCSAVPGPHSGSAPSLRRDLPARWPRVTHSLTATSPSPEVGAGPRRVCFLSRRQGQGRGRLVARVPHPPRGCLPAGLIPHRGARLP